MLSIGIVGLPNVGKSTLFNALTKNNVLAANYPFATIEPNVGIVNVPDKRINKLAEISSSVKTIPASCSFTDIAGIVRGASEGAGLGNKFLSHIRECSAIAQVVRAFVDNDVIHVEGKVDEKDDIETIRAELCLADIMSVTKRIDNLKKESKTNPKAGIMIKELEDILIFLDKGELVSEHFNNSPESILDLQLLTAKKFIYVFNIDEDQLGDEDLKSRLQALVPNCPCVFLSAKTEAELMDLPEDESKELLASLGQDESGLEALIGLGYKTLGLQSYFTTGPQETRGWTINEGWTAPQAAGVIHTDFEKGFIKAEVVDFDSFVSGNGWTGAGSSGKVRLEGKDYIMQDGDIVVFRHNS